MFLGPETTPSAVAHWCGGEVMPADGGTGESVHIVYNNGKSRANFREWIVCQNREFMTVTDAEFQDEYSTVLETA